MLKRQALRGRAAILAIGLFATAPAVAETETTGQAGPSAAKPAAAAAPSSANPAHATPLKVVAPASTAEQRSAAAVALSREPTYDEGSAQRIKDAALSY